MGFPKSGVPNWGSSERGILFGDLYGGGPILINPRTYIYVCLCMCIHMTICVCFDSSLLAHFRVGPVWGPGVRLGSHELPPDAAMTMSVCVRLLSGRAVDIEVEEGSSVHEVQQQAQQMLGVRGRLVKSDGTTLASMKCTVLQAGLSDDESLTLQASPALRVLAGSFAAFAGVLNDDTLVLWGEEMPFGSSEYESGQLKNVCQVAATTDAFAALLWDGSVVTWGDKRCGGDSSAVKEQLRDVKQIVGSRCDMLGYEPGVLSNNGAFAAILGDGSVVTWGSSECGGDSSSVQHQLKDVQHLAATSGSFAALLQDGSVVTWGDADRGGRSFEVQAQLCHVQQIYGSDGAFAAVKDDGSVVTWGHQKHGSFSCHVEGQLRDVRYVSATSGAFAALLQNGSVVAWGDENCGGDSRAVQGQLQKVQFLAATLSSGRHCEIPSSAAFAAILGDGSVVTWGSAECGGDSSSVQHQLKNVQHIAATSGSFAALLQDGSVVTWGDVFFSGDSDSLQDQLHDIHELYGTTYCFTALRNDGSIVCWGDRSFTLSADELLDE